MQGHITTPEIILHFVQKADKVAAKREGVATSFQEARLTIARKFVARLIPHFKHFKAQSLTRLLSPMGPSSRTCAC